MSDAIEDWFDQAGPRAEELRRVDELVMAAAPDIDRQLVPVGSQAMKRHLSLYVCAVVDGGYIAEQRAERLGKVSCGKSCIRFTSLDAVDADELSAVLRDAVAVTASGDNAYYFAG
jgi:hypothetical protein